MEQQWSELLSKLPDEDIDWIMSFGEELHLPAKMVLVNENTEIDYLYFVLKGLFSVNITLYSTNPIALLGPGKIIGELSFIDNRTTSASVIAIEASSVYSIPRKLIKKRMKDDQGFGLRLYKALCEITAGRLRATSQNLMKSMSFDTNIGPGIEIKEWSLLKEEIDKFKQAATEADKRALRNNNQITNEDMEEVQKKHHLLTMHMNYFLNGSSTLPEPLKYELGGKVQSELLPLVLLTKTAERFYSKPRGYSGDYITIERLYRNKPEGHGRLGPVIDACIINEPAGKAVRNRRKFIADEIIKTVNNKNEEKARVASIASGPASEVFDAFATLQNKNQLESTLIDFDQDALASVEKKLKDTNLKEYTNLINENILYLILGRKKIDLANQDLVYSMGLLDYLNDKIAIKLLDFIYDTLAPDGRVVLGNFHPKNSLKAYMDHVLAWRLTHRTANDMDSLFKKSKFQSTCSNISFEPEGVNLFAECRKN